MGSLNKVGSLICSKTFKSKLRSVLALLGLVSAFTISSMSCSNAADNASTAKKVDPVPKGYHTITPFVQVKNALEAIEFYKKAFGAQQLELFATPDGKKVVHAELKIGDSIMMISDDFTGKDHPDQIQTTLHMYVPDVDKSFERAVNAGAKVEMPVQDMFWGDRFGGLIDPYGQHWSISSHKEDVPTEEIAKRAHDFFENLKKSTDESIKQADSPKK